MNENASRENASAEELPRENSAADFAQNEIAVSPSLLTILQLMRIPNIFTAIADVMMGYLIVRGGLHEPILFFLVLGSSCALYLSGMVLNDVYDVDLDAQERPHRPIPSGRVSLGFARKLGFGLMLLGLACAVGICLQLGSLRPGIVAGLLALCIWLYDGVLKRTLVSPVLMGGCRMLNVLLAMSADPAVWVEFNWWVAAGLGVYIAGVTWFARTEASDSSHFQLAAGTLVAMAGIFILSRTPHFEFLGQQPDRIDLSRLNQLWIFLAAIIGWRMVRAVLQPEPQMIQPAVKVAVLSVIVLDATVLLGFIGLAGPAKVPWVLMIVLLYLPAMFLGRWIYST